MKPGDYAVVIRKPANTLSGFKVGDLVMMVNSAHNDSQSYIFVKAYLPINHNSNHHWLEPIDVKPITELEAYALQLKQQDNDKRKMGRANRKNGSTGKGGADAGR